MVSFPVISSVMCWKYVVPRH